jgi:sulfonate transport system permease protein
MKGSVMYNGRLKKQLIYNGWQLIIPLVILAIWSISTHSNLIKTVFIPYPEKVVTSFFDLWLNQGFFNDFTLSILTMVQGFFIGTLIGLFFGSLTGFSKKAGHLSELSFDSLRQVPPYAWFPLFILWFGMGNLVKVCVISYAVFWPVFLNTR